ncbi:ataxin-7-like protein 3 [Corticium candelabrum]|uniref:ataxin-7-like protein 3 n=1 Tax=Corticium candelabrum TaxID=121492 RepID=UPI002E26CF05|nr:ataxin-7-like protein 3 [Corticium candelabrum]
MDRREEKKFHEQLEVTINDMVDDVIVTSCAEIYKALVCGYYQWLSDSELSDHEVVVDEIGKDVFGHPPLKKSVDCTCPNCERVIAVSRFAPHLEKCMGMGRNSSRLARRRVPYTDKDAASGEDDDGDEWNIRQNQRKMKSQKVANGSPRLISRTKQSKTTPSLPLLVLSPRQSRSPCGNSSQKSNDERQHADSPDKWAVELLPGIQPFMSLPVAKRKAILSESCGVLSEQNSKMCTNRHPCSDHTDDERKAVWMQFIDETTNEVPDFQSVSIESYGEGLRVPLETELDIDVIDGSRDSNSNDGHSPSTTTSAKWKDELLQQTKCPHIPPVRIVPRKASRSKYSSRKRSRRR